MRGIEAALKILTEDSNKNIFVSEALRKLADREKMKATDISLASSLIYIVMRRRELWEKILNDGKFLHSKDKLPSTVNIAIVTGIGGLIELRRFSVGVLINGIIEYLKQNKFTKYAGVVNAVLRNIIEDKENIISRYKDSNSLEDRALIAGVPTWSLPAWNKTWNRTELKEIFEMFNIPAYSTIRNSDGTITRLNETVLPTSLEGFNEGLVSVQSESSILVASLVKKFCSSKNLRILDMCSGRGVKAGQVLQENQNAEIECWELSEKRSKSAERELERLKVKDRATFKIGEALTLESNNQNFSFIMLDAPCSCSGTWHRKPESKWRLDWRKFDNLVSMQKKLLERAVNLCQNGGKILYITCSLLKQENENVIAEILTNHSDCVEISNLVDWNDKKRFRRGKPYGIYILPSDSWLDGFYCSLIMKR